jgi:hypothetical protein
MIIRLEYLINAIFKKNLELLFGKDSYVTVNSIRYLTNSKTYIIDVNLKIGVLNEEEIGFLYPDSLNSLVKDSWDFLGIQESKISIISTIA